MTESGGSKVQGRTHSFKDFGITEPSRLSQTLCHWGAYPEEILFSEITRAKPSLETLGLKSRYPTRKYGQKQANRKSNPIRVLLQRGRFGGRQYRCLLQSARFHQSAGSSSSRSFAEQKDHSAGACFFSSSYPTGSKKLLPKSRRA
jgi:hypothetical protein